ncbi:nucleotidyltransferase family protein [Ruegeria marina]|uniref:MobA-like NTP transferase domain-containing protein n=1 Tax=Ruegeria marina TaxID=639004 RepID=A0A1G6WCH8_9RHOB|nr:nucleotidyltransferase family protein [Ruegeria marina]SDD63561.1 MobA-like NTP transferase domain-containing protein [Ruegeria marina]
MNQTRFPVMLFAAGFGTRMGDLTRSRPKPMIEVAGRPLIDHALDLAQAVEPPRIVANTHYLAPILANHLGPRGVLLSNEQPDILDTGGGLRQAWPLLGAETVFTMNTDAIWSGPNPLALLARAWEPERMDALLMCIPVAQTVGYTGQGDFSRDAQGKITRGAGLVYGGVQIVRMDGLADIPDHVFSLNRLWNRIGEAGRLFGLTYPGRWCDVGHPDGIAQAEEMLANV